MSKSGQLAGGGGSELAAARRDPETTQLLHVCGEHIHLVIDQVLNDIGVNDESLRFLANQMTEQQQNCRDLWHRPLYRALQSRYADCRCSPFGRVAVRNVVISGSMAERLSNPPRPPKWLSASDLDVMIELGPVQWTYPCTEETSRVKNTDAVPATASTADPNGQDSDGVPRLVIAETESPGFVLVLQERRDDCPHQERLPSRAEAVRKFFLVYQIMAAANVEQCSTNGPACSFSLAVTAVHGVSEVEEVACLHVPVWWFSDEFFTRHRRHDWPPEEVRDNIRRYGLHLVPVGAPGSTTEKAEWRLSFSRAEVVISSLLTDVQKWATIAFKVCRTALGEHGKVIKSYFVKTALYWLCEETPTEDWTSITQGGLKLLDYLDEAVRSGILRCYFWSDINLLRFASRTDRKAMKKVLGTIRQLFVRLLAHEISVMYPKLRELLTRETRRLSERQLFVRLTRWLIRDGVCSGVLRYMEMTTTDSLNTLPPVLALSYTPDEVIRLLSGLRHWRYVQTALYQALIVAPADVASRVHVSASDGGGFVCDAGPLLELLIEDDLRELLGDPDVVRAWLRHQHLLPETERPAGLPADLRSPRDLCDLLLNIPLLSWVLRESAGFSAHLSAPDKWADYQRVATDVPQIPVCYVPPIEQAREEAAWHSEHWRELADELHTKLEMDRQNALEMAYQVEKEQRQLSGDPETLAEHRRIRRSLQDPWQLRQFVFGGSH